MAPAEANVKQQRRSKQHEPKGAFMSGIRRCRRDGCIKVVLYGFQELRYLYAQFVGRGFGTLKLGAKHANRFRLHLDPELGPVTRRQRRPLMAFFSELKGSKANFHCTNT